MLRGIIIEPTGRWKQDASGSHSEDRARWTDKQYKIRASLNKFES